MQINFLVNPVFDGWEPFDTRLGGTEESVVRWSTDLVRRGHDVTVYRNGTETEPLVSNGVHYLERELYNGGGDVCINIKSSDIPPMEPTIYLTNETNASELDISLYDAVVWPSQWAVDNIPVNNFNVHIVPHGYDPTQIYPGKKIPQQCFYASSPDRGLDTLLEAWPQVVKAVPDATLILTYGAPQVDLPGVINLGEVDEETMNDLYRTSDIWCHPCSGGELYCIVGKKAQAAACIPVIIPTMALSETVGRGFKVDKPEDYAEVLTGVLNMPMEQRDALRLDVKEHAVTPTWEESTYMLLKVIEKVL